MSYLDIQLTAYTSTTTSFVQPAVSGSVDVTVISTGWMPLGVDLFISGGGYYTIERILDATRVRVINKGGTGCVSAGVVVPANARMIAVGQSGSGTGGGSAVISRTRYVDQGTAVAEADRDGSIGAPFATIAAAVESLLALEATEVSPPYYYTIACYPGDYSAEPALAWDTSAYGIALSIVAVHQGDYLAGSVVLPALVGRDTAGSLALSGVYALAGISGGWNYVRAVGCKLAGTIALPSVLLATVDCWLDQPELTCGGLTMSGGEIQAATTVAVTSGGAACQFSNCRPVIGEIAYAGTAGTVYVDSMADWAMGTTFTNCTKTVMA